MIPYTLLLVMAGTALIGAVAGALGVFIFLKGQSLLGDTVAHATLPGLALACLVTGSSHPTALLIGGALSSIGGTLCIVALRRTTTMSTDTCMGIILSCFFGAGLVLLTVLQKQSSTGQATVTKFLFGSAATLLPSDLVHIIGIGSVIVVVLCLLWKEYITTTFDPHFAHSIGLPTTHLDILLTVLLVLTIIIGLYAVGAILMSSMLITPAITARQWTNRIRNTVLLSATIGALCAIAGCIGSSIYSQIPTGPLITVIASACACISLFAPRSWSKFSTQSRSWLS